jgi:hypothetical protein
MMKQANNQALTLNPTQDLKCAQCKSQGKSEKMLKKKCLQSL